MVTTHFKYTLKKYKTPSDRVNCPVCGGRRTFAPYVDIETGQDLPARYGRCNRADQCGYHLNPYKDGFGTDQQTPDNFVPAPIAKPKPKVPMVDLPKVLLIDTLTNCPDNAFVRHLSKIFPAHIVSNLVTEYLIGDHNVWPGATVFWIVNDSGNIRAGQVKQFDETGHTAKNADGTSRTVWIHKLIPQETEWLPAYVDQDMRVDCLFGGHLLPKYPNKKIALFEAPKTAIMAAPYLPDILCLAVVAVDYLTIERVQALKGRTVILYPDASKDGKAFKKWSEKAEKWRYLAAFSTSSYLESTCSDEEKAKGFDFADLLERIPYVDNSIDNQLLKNESPEIILHYPALSESQKETNGWEIWAGKKNRLPEIWEPECRNVGDLEVFNQKVENSTGFPEGGHPHPIKKWNEEEAAEVQVSVPTYIDIAKYRLWAKKLGPFPKGEYVQLRSLSSEASDKVFNPRAFAFGRLNSVAAWANAKNDTGPKSKHIRQLIELREILSNNQ